ncbi:hypothetical protein FJY63_15105, partial [Candidatus Sumerlaeota bacterium]|nr:hypothetical protein [Candidatus Sumerlaeota bacterium]
MRLRADSGTSLAADTRLHFVDNRDGLTLDAALCAHLAALRQQEQSIGSVDIATAFFNVPGFNLLAEEFCRAPKVRLLLGAEPK